MALVALVLLRCREHSAADGGAFSTPWSISRVHDMVKSEGDVLIGSVLAAIR